MHAHTCIALQKRKLQKKLRSPLTDDDGRLLDKRSIYFV